MWYKIKRKVKIIQSIRITKIKIRIRIRTTIGNLIKKIIPIITKITNKPRHYIIKILYYSYYLILGCQTGR